jgi:hypothetical protein
MTADESALVVLVPEAEALVRPFRERHDPAAALGVPAHITLLYPFKPPPEIDATVLGQLQSGFADFAPVGFTLANVHRFPGVLYLATDPAEPFRALTRAIWTWSSETPPYGGRWPDIVPHLSIANVEDERELDRIAGQFTRACEGVLPIKATVNEVSLLEQREQRWMVRATFRLGSAPHSNSAGSA